MTDERLAEITARCNAATPKEWGVGYGYDAWHDCFDFLGAVTDENNDICKDVSKENAVFIANARQDLPDCLAEIHRLQAELESEKRRSEAAIADMDELRKKTYWYCHACKFENGEDLEKCLSCSGTRGHTGWVWRGTEAKHE